MDSKTELRDVEAHPMHPNTEMRVLSWKKREAQCAASGQNPEACGDGWTFEISNLLRMQLRLPACHLAQLISFTNMVFHAILPL